MGGGSPGSGRHKAGQGLLRARDDESVRSEHLSPEQRRDHYLFVLFQRTGDS